MDEATINNMKVAELKKELKARGFSVIGNKSDLVSRLLQAVRSANATAKNEDSLLNEDDDVNSDILNGSEDGKTYETINEEALIGTTNIGATTDVTKSPQKIIIQPTKTIRETAETSMRTISTKVKITKVVGVTNNQQTSAESASTDGGAGGDSPNKIKLGASQVKTLNERLALRAQKFGDKLASRAERFGLGNTEASKNTTAQTTAPTTEVSSSEALEKFKKRAERFGTVVSDNLKKVEEQEKLLKRKERFGEVTSATLKRSISNVPSEIDARKKARLERFGAL